MSDLRLLLPGPAVVGDLERNRGRRPAGAGRSVRLPRSGPVRRVRAGEHGRVARRGGRGPHRIEPRHQRAGGRGGPRRPAGTGRRRPGRGGDGASRELRSPARPARLRGAARCGGAGSGRGRRRRHRLRGSGPRLAAVGAARREPRRHVRDGAAGAAARTRGRRAGRRRRRGVDVDPVRAVAALADRGLRRVLVEGGPTLLGEIVAAGVLDELCLTWSPLVVGGGAPRIAHGGSHGAPAAGGAPARGGRPAPRPLDRGRPARADAMGSPGGRRAWNDVRRRMPAARTVETVRRNGTQERTAGAA